MNKKILLLFIAIICILICTAPAISAGGFFGLFGDDTSIEVDNLHIQQVKKIHTDSDGNTKKSSKYYLKFNVSSDSDSIGNNSVSVKCLDKDNKPITTIHSYVDSKGVVNIYLPDASGIKSANVTIEDSSGNVIYNNVTSKVKVTEKVTKDEPAVKKESTSSSSDSGETYWGSAKSGKFHRPSCEWAQKIHSSNKVVFHSRSEAINAGYQPCHVCSP